MWRETITILMKCLQSAFLYTSLTWAQEKTHDSVFSLWYECLIQYRKHSAKPDRFFSCVSLEVAGVSWIVKTGMFRRRFLVVCKLDVSNRSWPGDVTSRCVIEGVKYMALCKSSYHVTFPFYGYLISLAFGFHSINLVPAGLYVRDITTLFSILPPIHLNKFQKFYWH